MAKPTILLKVYGKNIEVNRNVYGHQLQTGYVIIIMLFGEKLETSFRENEKVESFWFFCIFLKDFFKKSWEKKYYVGGGWGLRWGTDKGETEKDEKGEGNQISLLDFHGFANLFNKYNIKKNWKTYYHT